MTLTRLGLVAILLLSMVMGCSAQPVSGVSVQVQHQEGDDFEVVIPLHLDTCGLFGAAKGYRQYQLACLNFDEDPNRFTVDGSCPASLQNHPDDIDPVTKKRKEVTGCDIYEAVLDSDGPGEWTAYPSAVDDCDWCAVYTERGNNAKAVHPEPLACDDPNNVLTGLFFLSTINKESEWDGSQLTTFMDRDVPVLLFQSTHGVRGVLCENRNSEGIHDCTIPSPEVAGHISPDGTLELFVHRSGAVPTSLFKGARLTEFKGATLDNSPSWYESLQLTIGSKVLQLYQSLAVFCTDDPSLPLDEAAL